jgi:hypothetical protein
VVVPDDVVPVVPEVVVPVVPVVPVVVAPCVPVVLELVLVPLGPTLVVVVLPPFVPLVVLAPVVPLVVPEVVPLVVPLVVPVPLPEPLPFPLPATPKAHTPCSHDWSALHGAQAAPLAPQCSVAPIWQMPLASQQPVQLLGPHLLQPLRPTASPTTIRVAHAPTRMHASE